MAELMEAASDTWRGSVALRRASFDHDRNWRQPTAEDEPKPRYIVRPREGSEAVIKAVLKREVIGWGSFDVTSQAVSREDPFEADGLDVDCRTTAITFRKEHELTPEDDLGEFWTKWRRATGNQLSLLGGFRSIGRQAPDCHDETHWALEITGELQDHIEIDEMLGDRLVSHWPPPAEALPPQAA